MDATIYRQKDSEAVQVPGTKLALTSIVQGKLRSTLQLSKLHGS
jgi:hypothetical protein